MLWNEIPKVCFYFHSTERNSEHCYTMRNGSEQNSESFLFRGMVQNGIPRVCFYYCSMIQFSEHFPPLRNSLERNSEGFLFHGMDRIPQEQTNCSVYSVFCGIIFFVGNCQPYLGYMHLSKALTWNTCEYRQEKASRTKTCATLSLMKIEKLTTGAVVPAGGDVVREGVN